MVDPESKSSSKRSYSSLLLRVCRPDGSVDEVYLAEGLTIGRSQANTIQLPDEPDVARSHAKLSIQEDGTARLLCLDGEAKIAVNGTRLHDLLLRSGMSFQIGRTTFECAPGLRQPFRDAAAFEPSCPFCGVKEFSDHSAGAAQCPGCNQPLFVLAEGTAARRRTTVPAQFGNYRVLRFVARGGMGLVLQGVDDRTSTSVAIKLLLPTRGVGTTAAERFKQEIALLKTVRHRNVVKLLDYGRAARINYLVLDWINGPSLRNTITDLRSHGGQLPFDQAMRWFEDICKGLAALHSVGIVHRDLKPSNILVAPPDKTALICDLGIAKHVDQTTAVTATGEMPGTVEYMAPEQLSAPDTVDGRADLYALGVMIYEMLTSRRPVGAWLAASQINSTVPPACDQIIGKLLAQHPDDRFADVHDLLVAISILRMDQRTEGPNAQQLANPSLEDDRRSTDSQIAPAGVSWTFRLGQLICLYPRTAIPLAIIVSTLLLPFIGRQSPQEWLISTFIIIPICGTILYLNWLWSRDKPQAVIANLTFATIDEQKSEYDALTRHRKSNNRQSIVTGLCGFILVLTGYSLPFLLPGAGSLLPGLCRTVGMILFCFGGGFYAKYKGHSPAWGLLCVVSLFLLAILPDRNGRRLAKLKAVLGPSSRAIQEKPVQSVSTSLRSSLLSASGASIIVTSLLLSWGLMCAFSPSAANLTSADGRFTLTLPSGWHENRELLSQAPGLLLAASDLVGNRMLVLIAEKKTDFADMSTDRYAALIRDVRIKQLVNADATPVTTNSQNGRLVFQFELRATADNVNLAYLVTVFDTEQDYCAVTAWTLASQFTQYRSELDQISLSAVRP